MWLVGHSMISRSIRKLLVLAVGGGNGGISTLWLLQQMQHSHGLDPEIIDLLCMLPDGVDYHGLLPATIDGLFEVTPASYRTIGGERVKPFPEPTLAAHKGDFGLRGVYGACLTRGTVGFSQTLHELVEREKYDLLLAVDVGGGFIATDENTRVLSPWMDAYAAFALQKLQVNEVCPIEVAVMGLGTDGESTPEMIESALARVQPHSEGLLEAASLSEITRFYQDFVRPKRQSQTGDLMVEAISGRLKSGYTVSRYFHVRQWMGTHKFVAEQAFHLDPRHAGKYYLFNGIHRIGNRFIRQCNSSLEWVRMTQDPQMRFQHELVNQTVEGGLMATPSWLFPPQQREEILAEVKKALKTGHYEKVFLYPQDYEQVRSRRTEGKVIVLHSMTQ